MKNEKPDTASCREAVDWKERPSSPDIYGDLEDSSYKPGRRNSHVSLSDNLRTASPALSSEDYNSWEAAVSADEMQQLQRELVGFDGGTSLIISSLLLRSFLVAGIDPVENNADDGLNPESSGMWIPAVEFYPS